MLAPIGSDFIPDPTQIRMEGVGDPVHDDPLLNPILGQIS